MIKALSAVAVGAFVAAGIAVVLGFAPKVEASVPAPLARGDRLDIHQVASNCSQQTWPNIEASCLREAGSKMLVGGARLVTADRAP
jgi:hypothetical protein